MTETAHAQDDLLPGFEAPVVDAARGFRAILEAMARPGSVQPLPVAPAAPAGWTVGMSVAALCLVDADTPVWLAPGIDTPAARGYVAFHCGAPVVSAPEAASFILASVADLPTLRHKPAIGSEEYPDRSATLILHTDGFEGPEEAVLSGPGIAGEHRLAPSGLDAEGWSVLRDNAALFPLGFDTIFAGPDAVAALPRSTLIGQRDG